MKNQNLKSLKSILFAALLVFGTFACKKDNDPAPGGGSSDSQVAGKWKISAITIDPAQDGISDLLAFLEALTGNQCISQTVFDFKAGGAISGTVPAGCSDEADDVLQDQATWKVVGNKIQLKEGNDITEYDLDVSGSQMKWTMNEVDNGVNYKVTLVFKKA